MKIEISYPDSLLRVSPKGERHCFEPDIEFNNMTDARIFAYEFLCELFRIKVKEVED